MWGWGFYPTTAQSWKKIISEKPKLYILSLERLTLEWEVESMKKR
jgi:hypothetical protein